MHKWDQSIKVAEMRNHPDLDHLKKNYYQWLTDSGQEEEAGKWKEVHLNNTRKNAITWPPFHYI
jgi:phage terminase Nu1 subunit (DNA packaging protein)